MTGFALAKELGYDFVVQCDSDGQHPLEDIARMVQEAERDKTDMLIASRFVGGTSRIQRSLESTTYMRRLGGLGIALTLRMLTQGRRITDPTSGFRVYSRKAIEKLIANMPDEYPEPESIAILATCSLKIGETRVSMRPRITGESSISGFKSMNFMIKVISALLGLKVREVFKRA